MGPHVMQVLSDGGGIYTLGRQPESILQGNHIHHVPKNRGRAESNGMFLDQGTSRFVIKQNVIHDIYRSPLRFHKALDNLVRKNVLVRRTGEVPVIRYHNTRPEDIIKKENRTPVRKNGQPSMEDGWFDDAGLQPPHSRRLLK